MKKHLTYFTVPSSSGCTTTFLRISMRSKTLRCPKNIFLFIESFCRRGSLWYKPLGLRIEGKCKFLLRVSNRYHQLTSVCVTGRKATGYYWDAKLTVPQDIKVIVLLQRLDIVWEYMRCRHGRIFRTRWSWRAVLQTGRKVGATLFLSSEEEIRIPFPRRSTGSPTFAVEKMIIRRKRESFGKRARIFSLKRVMVAITLFKDSKSMTRRFSKYSLCRRGRLWSCQACRKWERDGFNEIEFTASEEKKYYLVQLEHLYSKA